jgi:HEXXH motif-containing protein
MHGLVLPRPDAAPIPALLARHLAATAGAFLAAGERLPPALRPAHAALARAVSRALRADRRAALACFASPTVATPIRCLPLAAAEPRFAARISDAAARMLPHLALELALRRLLDGGFTWEAPIARLASPALGVALHPPAAPLHFSSGRLAAGAASIDLDPPALAAGGPFRPAPAWIPVGPSRLALSDDNPIADLEAHPDKAGNAFDLGGRTAAEWTAALAGAFAPIARHLPEIQREMAALLHEIVPVGYQAERHLSASYCEAIGTVYLTLHPNPLTLAEALVHEFQHTKLNLAGHAAPLLENALSPLYPSPVRPDPRPLHGVLLAAHAFLAVAVLHRRMRAAGAWSPDAERRLSEIDLKNHEAMELLRAHASPTPDGRDLLSDLDQLDRAHMADRAARGLPLSPTAAHTD